MPLLPGALERIEWDVDMRIGAAARTGAAITKAHLNEPGTGIKYPNLPNRSSAPGEYPARQFGPLQDSIGSDRVAATVYHVGSIHNPPPEAFYMEFKPVVGKWPHNGGRPWLSRSMEDAETHVRMNQAARAGSGGGD